jgi:hypothetical protein
MINSRLYQQILLFHKFKNLGKLPKILTKTNDNLSLLVLKMVNITNQLYLAQKFQSKIIYNGDNQKSIKEESDK